VQLQLPYRCRKRHAVDLHDEGNAVSVFVAAEAGEHVLRDVHGRHALLAYRKEANPRPLTSNLWISVSRARSRSAWESFAPVSFFVSVGVVSALSPSRLLTMREGAALAPFKSRCASSNSCLLDISSCTTERSSSSGSPRSNWRRSRASQCPASLWRHRRPFLSSLLGGHGAWRAAASAPGTRLVYALRCSILTREASATSGLGVR
jgi:hypothetical protein